MKNGVISKEFIKSSIGHTLMTYCRKEVSKILEKKYLYYILILIAYLAVVIQGFTQSINEGLARVMACSVAFYIFMKLERG